MSLETALFTALKSLVGNRMSPVSFPQPPAVPTWPAIRYTFIDSVPDVDICGSGYDATAETRVQLDIVAATFDAARSIRLSVITAMQSFSPPAILDSSRDGGFDPETKTYTQILDYIFHPSS